MKKFLNDRIFTALFIVFLITIVPACKKSDNNNNAVAGLPTVITTALSAVTQTSATCGGNVTNEGSSTVTFRGVCWSTHKTPTINDNKSLDGKASGLYTSLLKGLSDGATYYVRAYATNSSGTAYGSEVSFYALVLGEAYQDGLLAYILQKNDPGYEEGVAHGLIAASVGAVFKFKWDDGTHVVTGAIATALGKGNDNTNTIVTAQGNKALAAKYCADLVIGGHSDWYLPSRDELYKLYLSRNELGDYYGDYYWSSSEVSINEAYIQSFINGAKSTYSKVGEFWVRPVRSF